MAFLEKMGETLAAKGRDVADKAKEAAEVNHLKGQVNSQKNLAEKIYVDIGKTIYEHREDWSSVNVSPQMEQLDSIQAEIGRLQEKIMRVKGIRRCEACGAEIAKNASSCPKCGSAVTVAEEEVEAEKEGSPAQDAQKTQDAQQVQERLTDRLCPGCHRKMEPGMVFCPFCGTRI